MADNVKVAVRMRPFNQREKDLHSTCCVRMVKSTQQTILVEPESGKERTFTFDFSYNSFVPRDDSEYASQDIVWTDIGSGVLDNAYQGYNCSLFAYGQTGAGKSYSMMGYGEDKGIIPIACERIFDKIDSNTDDTLTIKVEASMLEIYMEKVRDLFNPKLGELKIRNDPKRGFYVENLTRNAVASVSSINKLMDAGTKARTVAATNMNATSSRAHTIFQIVLTQTKVDAEAGKATDKVAIINLIDLAGSERQSGTGATGDRLKEGSAINLSLSSLGNCISALATNSSAPDGKKVRVPYRDSVLTMLLQNSLGGNAKTIMIAAISPADVNHDETLSTLRYADRAKQIKNNAVVNEDPNEKLIRNLKTEIEELRKALQMSGGGAGGPSMGPAVDMSSMLEKERLEMRAKFEEEAEAERQRIRQELAEKIRKELEQSMGWEERLKETEARQKEQEDDLRAAGIATGAERDANLERAKTVPHVVNLHEDAAMNETIHYFFEPGQTMRFGREDAPIEQNVTISGLNIEAQHAVIENNDGRIQLTLPTPGAKMFVNGLPVTTPVQLRHNDRVIFGNNHVFKVIIPSEAKSYVRPDDVPGVIDHTFAVMEINKAQVQAIAAAEAARRAEAEAARLKAEEQIREIEAQLAEERRKAEAEAAERQKYFEAKEKELLDRRQQGFQSELKEQEDRLRKEKEEMLRVMQEQQKVLEEKLQHQIEETNKQAKRKETEAKQRSLLDEKLLKTIPLVNEANAYSEELGVGLAFSVKLMSLPGRKPAVAASGAGDDDSSQHSAVLDTDVFVRVDTSVSATFATPAQSSQKFWTYDKFMDRLYNMREMYQKYVESGRSLEGTEYCFNKQLDPFYDEPEDHMIGRATVYLDPLVYVMFIDEWTPVIDYKGQTQGELLLRVIPHAKPEPPKGEPESWDTSEGTGFDVDSLDELKQQRIYITVSVLAGRGFPPDRCTHNFVKFRFYLEEECSTDRTAARTINPKFNFSKTMSFVVTPELQQYVSSETVEFEVFGRESVNEDVRPTTAISGSVYATAVLRQSPSVQLLNGSPSKQSLRPVKEDENEEREADVFDLEAMRAEQDAEEQAKIAAAVKDVEAAALKREQELKKQLESIAAEQAAHKSQAEAAAAQQSAQVAEMQRKLEEERVRLAEEAAKAAAAVQSASNDAEKERIAAMQREMEELKRKLEESQQKKGSKICVVM